MMGGRDIGILGGMFDPVHIGHLRTAIMLREALTLDEVRLLPCARPAHRPAAMASDHDRLKMLELAIAGVPGLQVDDRECRREGTSWLYDTLLSFRAEYPESRLFFILGSDAFSQLESWHRWQELLGLCHWLVVPRPGWQLQLEGALADEWQQRLCQDSQALMAQQSGGMWKAPPSVLELSSTELRNMIARGSSLRFLLPEPVIDYIDKQQLYRP